MEINFNKKHFMYVSLFWQFFLIIGKISDMVNSNICIAKICWTKSNFPSKFDFMSDEDKTSIRSLPVKVLSNSSTFYLCKVDIPNKMLIGI